MIQEFDALQEFPAINDSVNETKDLIQQLIGGAGSVAQGFAKGATSELYNPEGANEYAVAAGDLAGYIPLAGGASVLSKALKLPELAKLAKGSKVLPKASKIGAEVVKQAVEQGIPSAIKSATLASSRGENPLDSAKTGFDIGTAAGLVPGSYKVLTRGIGNLASTALGAVQDISPAAVQRVLAKGYSNVISPQSNVRAAQIIANKIAEAKGITEDMANKALIDSLKNAPSMQTAPLKENISKALSEHGSVFPKTGIDSKLSSNQKELLDVINKELADETVPSETVHALKKLGQQILKYGEGSEKGGSQAIKDVVHRLRSAFTPEDYPGYNQAMKTFQTEINSPLVDTVPGRSGVASDAMVKKIAELAKGTAKKAPSTDVNAFKELALYSMASKKPLAKEVRDLGTHLAFSSSTDNPAGLVRAGISPVINWSYPILESLSKGAKAPINATLNKIPEPFRTQLLNRIMQQASGAAQ